MVSETCSPVDRVRGGRDGVTGGSCVDRVRGGRDGVTGGSSNKGTMVGVRVEQM